MPFEIPTGADIPDGSYTAVLERVNEAEGNFGRYREWYWLVDVDGKAESLKQLTSANTGPKSKSYVQLTALLGRAPKAGEQIEDPTGTRVVLKIGKNEKGFPTVQEVTQYVEPTQTVAGIPR